MGIPFFIVFALSIVFLSLGMTGWGDLVSVEWPEQNPSAATVDEVVVTPYLGLKLNYRAIAQCLTGFLLFLVSLYVMGFLLYLEERESGRIMKNVKSFAKLRQFLERRQKRGLSQ
jgi:hypothetical protein